MRQRANRLGWVALAYLEMEAATAHLGSHKHSLQYDRGLTGAFGCGFGRETLVARVEKKFVKN